MEVCVVTDFEGEQDGDIVFRTLPGVEYAASIMVAGSFENINPGYLALAEWLEQHGEYEMQGASRVITVRGPWNEQEPEQYLTELQIPVTPRKK